jgi:hypothetical protein
MAEGSAIRVGLPKRFPLDFASLTRSYTLAYQIALKLRNCGYHRKQRLSNRTAGVYVS